MTPDEYRERHHRCSMCQYLELKKSSYLYDYCNAKGKYVNSARLVFPAGMLCKLYKPVKFKEVR